MAIIKRGILGGFSNKIGNIVGTSWKGIAVMKSLPLSVANPQTAGQVETRTKFGLLAEIGSKWLAAIIKPLWDRSAGQMSGFNHFLQMNMPYVTGELTVDWANLIMSHGKLGAEAITTATANGTTNVLTVNYVSSAGQGFALSSDICYVGIAVGELEAFWGWSGDTRGVAGAQSVVVTGFDLVAGTVYHVYLAFRRADGTMVSDSTYKLVTAT